MRALERKLKIVHPYSTYYLLRNLGHSFQNVYLVYLAFLLSLINIIYIIVMNEYSFSFHSINTDVFQGSLIALTNERNSQSNINKIPTMNLMIPTMNLVEVTLEHILRGTP